jgi:hypothetical protein
MKTSLINKGILGAITLLSACAQQIPNNLNDLTSRISATETIYEKVCPTSQKLLNTSGAKLSEFFGTIINVDYLEGPVTFCLFVDKLSSSIGTNVESGFAIELEQGSPTVTSNDRDDGILFMEFGQTAQRRIKSVVFLNSTTNIVTIDLIYRDNYGLVQVKGSGNYNTAIRADVKFYNFPTYEEAVSDAAARRKAACLAAIEAGDGTAAEKCWGLQPALDKAWWLTNTTQPTQQDLLRQAAEEVLNDATRSKKLGEIDIKLDEVL